MACGFGQEDFSHTECAARGLGGGAVIHQGKALFRNFAEVNLPCAAHKLIGINLGGELGLLLVLLILAVAVTVTAAFAAVFTATVVAFATANGFGGSKAGCRLGGAEVAGFEFYLKPLFVRDLGAGLLLWLVVVLLRFLVLRLGCLFLLLVIIIEGWLVIGVRINENPPIARRIF